MIKNGVLEQTALESPLAATSQINPKSNSKKKALVAVVILTSLIDAFSILVIYLLVNFSNSGEILYISKGMQLPVAEQSKILERTTVVKLEEGQVYIEDKPVVKGSLVSRLVDLKKELIASKVGEMESFALTVQADRRVTYKELNQVVLAGSHAGFGEIKFAVLSK